MRLGFGQRYMFVGRTGSGKTYGMFSVLGLMYGKRQIQVLETKDDPLINRYRRQTVKTLGEVVGKKFPTHPMVVWKPEAIDMVDPERLDAWADWCYRRKNTIAAIDELTQLCPGVKPLPGYLSLITRGRTQDVTTLHGVQRPAWVPRIAFSENEHFFVFKLADSEDRKRVAQVTVPEIVQPVRDKHGFWYYQTGEDSARYYPHIQAFLEEVDGVG